MGLLGGSLKRKGLVFILTFLLHVAWSFWNGGFLEDGSNVAKQRRASGVTDDFVEWTLHPWATHFQSFLCEKMYHLGWVLVSSRQMEFLIHMPCLQSAGHDSPGLVSTLAHSNNSIFPSSSCFNHK